MNETLLYRFLTHSCSVKELKNIESWLKQDEANSKWLNEVLSIWSIKHELKFSDKKYIDKAYKKTLKYQIRQKRFINISLKTWYFSAASIVCILLSINIIKLNSNSKELFNTIHVPEGQRVELMLSDGTYVWLNSMSKFTYPSKFSEKNRIVNLEGEGYFEVKHFKNKPFIVQSKYANIKVLGTKFNYKCYPEMRKRVTLLSGSIELSANNRNEKLLIKPNECVTFDSNSTLFRIHKTINAQLSKDWINGTLSFDNQPLSEIIIGLEKHYNIKIVIENSTLADKRFTCNFKEGTSLHEVLHFLEETKLIKYQFMQDYIKFINPKIK